MQNRIDVDVMPNGLSSCSRDEYGRPYVPAKNLQEAIEAGYEVRSGAVGRAGYIREVRGRSVYISRSRKGKITGCTTFIRGDPVKMVWTAPNRITVINALDEGW